MAIVAWGCGAKQGQAETSSKQQTARSTQQTPARQSSSPGRAADSEPGIKFAQAKEQPVTAKLITEHTSIAPGGKTRVGVLFKIQEGWHIYYKEPGDAGLATEVAWQEFPGAIFGELQWPEPSHFTDPGNIRTNGYAKQIVLSNTLTLITRETPDAVLLHAKVKWLACREICLPGSAKLDASLPVNSATQALSQNAALFPQANP